MGYRAAARKVSGTSVPARISFDKDNPADASSDVGRNQVSSCPVWCVCTMPRAHSAQLRRSQPAFIMVMIMKLVSVTNIIKYHER